jgi:hypothetical protein
VRRLVWLGPAGAGVLAIAAFFVGRGAASTSGAGPSALAPSAPPRPAAAMLSGAPSLGAAGSAAAPPGSVVSPTASAQSAPVPSVPADANDAAEAGAAERAQLVLLGDGASARVDGTPRGACPLRLTVDAGLHVVTFTFPATGEARSERVALRGGERATLRADFTGAAPTIRVERRAK